MNITQLSFDQKNNMYCVDVDGKAYRRVRIRVPANKKRYAPTVSIRWEWQEIKPIDVVYDNTDVVFKKE